MMQAVRVTTKHKGLIGTAKTRHRPHECIEHRLEVDGGAADDLEHVCCGCLLLQGLCGGRNSSNSRVFSIAITAWSAKVCSSLTCLVTERDRLQSTQAYCTDSLAFLQQGYGKGASVTLLQRPSLPLGKLGCSLWSQKVRNLYRHLVDDRSTSDPLSSDAVCFAGYGYWSMMSADNAGGPQF